MYTTISENEVSLTKFISENETNIISIPKEVKFENKTYSIISIGERAFDRLLFSFEIEIPNSIQRIEKRAFQFCEKLEGSLILPDSITFIGEYAFYSCFSLNGELKLPKGLKTIEKGTFMYCGFSGSLILPTKLESIKKGAFEWCKFDGILNLASSKSLEKISETAFWCCSQFSGDLILPSTLKKIGWRAFYHCSGFSNVFYEGLENLNDDSDSEVFRGCNFHNIYVSSAYEDNIFCDLVAINNKSDILIDNLYYRIIKNDTKSTITNSNIACVISYSNTCDFNCSIIIKEQILVNETNISVISIGEIAFSYSKFTGNLIIPSTIKTIKERAFYHCGGIIGQLILPNGIEKIGDYAFYHCSSFSGSLEIPNTISNVGEYAFSECSSLNGKLTLPNALHQIEDGIFKNCCFEGNLIVPKTVVSIGKESFQACRFNGELKLSSSLLFIKENAFSRCSFFTGTLKLPKTLLEIKSGAFQFCFGFKKIIFEGSININRESSTDAFGNCNIRNIFVVSEFDDVTFCGLIAIKESIDILDNDVYYRINLESKNASVISYNDQIDLMNDIIIADSIYDANNISYSVDTIGDSAFSHSPIHGKLSLPNSIFYINDFAFSYCDEIKGSLILPTKLKRIGKNAFEYCSKLNGSLNLPDSIVEIGEFAFSSCFGFEGSLKLPNSLKVVTKNLFYYCSFTGSLIVPDSVHIIESNAFEWCKFNGTLTLSQSLQEIHKSAFWCCSDFIGSLTLPNTLKVIGSFAFLSCFGFNSTLILPSSLTRIGTNAFERCRMIDAVQFLGNREPEIGDGIFHLTNISTIYVTSSYKEKTFAGIPIEVIEYGFSEVDSENSTEYEDEVETSNPGNTENESEAGGTIDIIIGVSVAVASLAIISTAVSILLCVYRKKRSNADQLVDISEVLL